MNLRVDFDGIGDWQQCSSCRCTHAVSFIACNGLREPCDERCAAVLGEAQCRRPANHLGVHEALSEVMRIEWEML